MLFFLLPFESHGRKEQDSDPQSSGTDPGIRIRIKMSRILKTDSHVTHFSWVLPQIATSRYHKKLALPYIFFSHKVFYKIYHNHSFPCTQQPKMYPRFGFCGEKSYFRTFIYHLGEKIRSIHRHQ